MAKRRRRRSRPRTFAPRDIWTLSNEIMAQQLGQQTSQLRSQYEREVLPMLGQAMAEHAGQVAAANSQDEANFISGALAESVAGAIGQAASGWRGAMPGIVAPWTRDVGGFVGSHGGPEQAITNIRNAASGAPLMFELGAAPAVQAARDEAHNYAMQAKLDRERADAELANTAQQGQLAARDAYRQYLDALHAMQPKDVQWAPQDYADYLKMQEAFQGEWAKSKADYAGINADLQMDALDEANKAWEDARKTRGKQTKAHKEAMKRRKAALADMVERMSKDEGLWGEHTSMVPVKLTRQQQIENQLAINRGEKPPHATEEEVTTRYRKGWEAAYNYLYTTYFGEFAEIADTFGLKGARLRKMIRAAMIRAGLRPGGFAGGPT